MSVTTSLSAQTWSPANAAMRLMNLLDSPVQDPRDIQRIAVVFGYRSCPDVCPTTLLAMHNALVALGPKADHVLVVFVTVDPDRDSAEQLRQYVAFFDPHIHSISAPSSVTRILGEFRVRAVRTPSATAGNYLMDHTAVVYVLDSGQRVLDAIPESIPQQQLIRRLTAALQL